MVDFNSAFARISNTCTATILFAILSTSIVAVPRGMAQVNNRGPARLQHPPLLTQLQGRTDELGFKKLVSRSTIEAEKFRRSLIREDAAPSSADTIARACVLFRELINKRAFRGTDPGQYDLSRFQLDQRGISESIQGTHKIPEPSQVYGSFEGKWFGIWEQKNVNHHWGEFKTLKPPQIFEIAGGEPVRLVGYQYAWVGDGYGLNHIATSQDGSRTFLLGYVIHIRGGQLNREITRRPHVGVMDGPNRLIWITKGEIFFEEMIAGKTKSEDQYFITGFRYSLAERKLVAKDAFQAVYSRDREERKPWEGFKIDLQVESPN